MKQRLACCASIVLFLVGCELVPGTEAHLKREAREAVAATMRDPAAADFRNLQVRTPTKGKLVCGEINGRNVFGAYVGFTRFLYGQGAYFVDPGPSVLGDDVAGADQRCKSLRRVGGGEFVCQQAEDLRRAQAVRAAFNDAWRQGCQLGDLGADLPATLLEVHKIAPEAMGAPGV